MAADDPSEGESDQIDLSVSLFKYRAQAFGNDTPYRVDVPPIRRRRGLAEAGYVAGIDPAVARERTDIAEPVPPGPVPPPCISMSGGAPGSPKTRQTISPSPQGDVLIVA